MKLSQLIKELQEIQTDSKDDPVIKISDYNVGCDYWYYREASSIYYGMHDKDPVKFIFIS